jgi:hypothetical protein
MSLAGDLSPENLPVTVLSAAITRARAKLEAWEKERALARQQAQKKTTTKVPRKKTKKTG